MIIWDDKRAEELLHSLGRRGKFFNIFDTKPKRMKGHVKFSFINLINEVNIVNGIEPYEEFLDKYINYTIKIS